MHSDRKLTNGAIMTLTSLTSHLVAGGRSWLDSFPGGVRADSGASAKAEAFPTTKTGWAWPSVPVLCGPRSWCQAGRQYTRHRAGRDFTRQLFRPPVTFRGRMERLPLAGAHCPSDSPVLSPLSGRRPHTSPAGRAAGRVPCHLWSHRQPRDVTQPGPWPFALSAQSSQALDPSPMWKQPARGGSRVTR